MSKFNTAKIKELVNKMHSDAYGAVSSSLGIHHIKGKFSSLPVSIAGINKNIDISAELIPGAVKVFFNLDDYRSIKNGMNETPDKYTNHYIKKFLDDMLNYIPQKNIFIAENQTTGTALHENVFFAEVRKYIDNLSNSSNKNTRDYIKKRTLKQTTKNILIIAQMPVTPFTHGINIPSLGLSLDSGKNSICHVKKLVDINRKLSGASDVNDMGELKGIVGDLIQSKSRKVFKKGFEVIFSSIPVDVSNISDTANTAFSSVKTSRSILEITKKIEKTKINSGIDKTIDFMIDKTVSDIDRKFDEKKNNALRLHFLAYKEQFLIDMRSKNDDAVNKALDFIDCSSDGMATEAFCEIFRQRGLSLVAHRYKPVDIIKEPMGWLALLGKLDGDVR